MVLILVYLYSVFVNLYNSACLPLSYRAFVITETSGGTRWMQDQATAYYNSKLISLFCERLMPAALDSALNKSPLHTLGGAIFIFST
jgi:hypothetical protein